MIDLGLQRISALLAQTPLPWRAIHVAGTNGKGSICAYISAMLSVYNRSSWRTNNNRYSLRHGRFTSPHLVDRWDCISINEVPVSGPVFQRIEAQVLERNRRNDIGASEFEVLTATAFEIFAQEKVDVGVVEVGMGGRLDATNILGQHDGLELPGGWSVEEFRPLPLVTVISSIGLDHQAFLGNTLEEIAREKAGIVKPGVPVVYDDSNPPEVIELIRSVAEANGSPVIDSFTEVPLPGSERDQRNSPRNSNLADHIASILGYEGYTVPRHTKQNATLAYFATWSVLQQFGCVQTVNENSNGHKLSFDQLALSELSNDMLEAVKASSFPGRQQRVSIEKLTGRKQNILLDGAHNAQSALALAEAVSTLRGTSGSDQQDNNVTWVLAASDSKDVKEILSPLLRDGDAVFAVEFGPVDGMPWVKPLAASKILDAAKAVVSNPDTLSLQDCGMNVIGGLKKASVKAGGRPMVVAGSLYLVGDVLRLLRDV